jgi:hypothetical protein
MAITLCIKGDFRHESMFPGKEPILASQNSAISSEGPWEAYKNTIMAEWLQYIIVENKQKQVHEASLYMAKLISSLVQLDVNSFHFLFPI